MNLDNYICKVYVDDIERWQECEVINISSYRATVRTQYGTQLNRIIKYAENTEMKEDGCVYFYKKEKGLIKIETISIINILLLTSP